MQVIAVSESEKRRLVLWVVKEQIEKLGQCRSRANHQKRIDFIQTQIALHHLTKEELGISYAGLHELYRLAIANARN